jgi:hypothetical protein
MDRPPDTRILAYCLRRVNSKIQNFLKNFSLLRTRPGKRIRPVARPGEAALSDVLLDFFRRLLWRIANRETVSGN